MSDRDEYQGWRVVEGPGTEDADEDMVPDLGDLGNEPVLGAGFGASTGGVDGEPGPPGAAPGGLPEHTGRRAVEGISGLYSAEDEGRDE